MDRPPYYIRPKAAPFAHKPFDWRRVKRDRHAAHNLSYRLSAQLRRMLRGQPPKARR